MFRLRLELAAAVTIFLLAWAKSAALEPQHEYGILPIDPPTPYIHYFAGDSPRGRVLVIHGLDVSKETTSLISAALADGGFEVYNIDLPGHGDSPARFQTEQAERAIQNAKTFLGEKTIVLGHSLGAGLLLDLAATETFSTMVLLSPPPLAISEIHAERVLIATGDIDIPRILTFVPIITDIGNSKVESWILPWGAHSAPIFNPEYIRRVVVWLGGDGQKTETLMRILWLVTMFVAALGIGVGLLPGQHLAPLKIPIPGTLVHFVVASLAALLILKVVNPLAWLRFFTTDYLIGFVLLTGLYLSWWAIGRTTPQMCKAATWKAVAAAAYVILVPGILVTSHILHMTLSAGRWWRFPCVVLAGLPLFIADELTIRRISPRMKSAAVAVVTRVLFLAFLLTGVLVLDRENAFLVLIAPLIVVFWIGLWFATGMVHRHTRNPFAAALFAAIVQGWAFAAWFVTI